MRIIRAAKVLTGRPGEVIADGEVLVDGARIVSVGPRGSAGRRRRCSTCPATRCCPGWWTRTCTSGSTTRSIR
ncbi:hypothetical protein ACFQQB_34310 [Nonomuraea rubra]|uniref:hypothetical protein n=1 Tax=Nonomuraea rubra TaxID=46180 RepID=UPI003605FEDA